MTTDPPDQPDQEPPGRRLASRPWIMAKAVGLLFALLIIGGTLLVVLWLLVSIVVSTVAGR